MANIDQLLSAIMGQADTNLAPAQPAPWQQELLESVNPEKVKRQNIARAVAQASTAMATTPGNFLQGISAAAATGANSYLTGKDEAEAQRLKVQQLLGMQQQQDQDRRMKLLMDAVGVAQGQEDRAYGRKKDEREWGLRKSESDARTDYYKRRGTGSAAGQSLNANQIRIAKQNILSQLDREEKKLRNPQGNQPWLEEDEIQQRLQDEQERLEGIFGVRLNDPDEPAGSSQNTSQSDLFAPRGPASGGGTGQVLTPEQYETSIPQQQGQGGILRPPSAAIEFLRKNPQHREQFDAKYGPGASAAILGN